MWILDVEAVERGITGAWGRRGGVEEEEEEDDILDVKLVDLGWLCRARLGRKLSSLERAL